MEIKNYIDFARNKIRNTKMYYMLRKEIILISLNYILILKYDIFSVHSFILILCCVYKYVNFKLMNHIKIELILRHTDYTFFHLTNF